MKRFENTRVLISPHSRQTIALADYLEKKIHAEVVGFIDRGKEEYHIDKAPKEYDAILVLSPQYDIEIYRELSKRLPGKKIHVLENKGDGYRFRAWWELFLDMYRLRPFLFRTYIALLKKLPIRDRAVFVGDIGIDANLKSTYMALRERGYDVLMLCDDSFAAREFRRHGLPVRSLKRGSAWYDLITAKFVFLSQPSAEYVKHCDTSRQYVIQLWHGVGLKKMTTRQKDFRYTCFISTSEWTNETNFRHIFKADRFLNLGYARCDVLLKEKPDRYDMILSDRELYEKAKNRFTVMYLPTFRNAGIDIPVDFERLDAFLGRHGMYMIVKLHYYVYENIVKGFSEGTLGCENIDFVTKNIDVYPLLRHCDILVTDYSSVAYDFLLLDREIVFFVFDYEEYVEFYGEFLFPFERFTPGVKVKSEGRLMQALEEIRRGNIDFREDRERIKRMFFDHLDSRSAERIVSLVEGFRERDE